MTKKEGRQGGREEVRGREKGRERKEKRKGGRKRDGNYIRGGNPPETLDLTGRMQPCLHAFYVCFPHRPTQTLELGSKWLLGQCCWVSRQWCLTGWRDFNHTQNITNLTSQKNQLVRPPPSPVPHPQDQTAVLCGVGTFLYTVVCCVIRVA